MYSAVYTCLLSDIQVRVPVQFRPDVWDSRRHWGFEANGFVIWPREGPVYQWRPGASSENGTEIIGAICQRYVIFSCRYICHSLFHAILTEAVYFIFTICVHIVHRRSVQVLGALIETMRLVLYHYRVKASYMSEVRHPLHSSLCIKKWCGHFSVVDISAVQLCIWLTCWLGGSNGIWPVWYFLRVDTKV